LIALNHFVDVIILKALDQDYNLWFAGHNLTKVHNQTHYKGKGALNGTEDDSGAV